MTNNIVTLSPAIPTSSENRTSEAIPELKFHEFANIFPMMERDKLKKLSEDIKTNEQFETIKIYDGKILDGRNRYKACQQAGKHPKTEEFIGSDKDALDYVISRNLHRRHLRESQRAMAAAKLVRASSTQICAFTQAQAATAFSVSPRCVSSAEALLKSCIPQLIQSVDDGEMAVSAAEKMSKLKPKKQYEGIMMCKRSAAIKKVATKQTEEPFGDPDNKVRMIPLTVLFSVDELRAFDTARGRHGCPDTREEFIRWSVIEFSDKGGLPPTKNELKKMIKAQKTAFYNSPAFSMLPADQRAAMGAHEDGYIVDKDHPDFDEKDYKYMKALERGSKWAVEIFRNRKAVQVGPIKI